MIELGCDITLILVAVGGIGWVLRRGLLLDNLHAIRVLFNVRSNRQSELSISLWPVRRMLGKCLQNRWGVPDKEGQRGMRSRKQNVCAQTGKLQNVEVDQLTDDSKRERTPSTVLCTCKFLFACHHHHRYRHLRSPSWPLRRPSWFLRACWLWRIARDALDFRGRDEFFSQADVL